MRRLRLDKAKHGKRGLIYLFRLSLFYLWLPFSYPWPWGVPTTLPPVLGSSMRNVLRMARPTPSSLAIWQRSARPRPSPAPPKPGGFAALEGNPGDWSPVPPGQYDLPENFSIFQNYQSKFHLQKFLRYESYGKISGRAYSGKLVRIDLHLAPSDYLLAVPPARGTTNRRLAWIFSENERQGLFRNLTLHIGNSFGKLAVQTIPEISAFFLAPHYRAVLAWGP